jgi:predicted dienelactone hydrolase
MSPNQRAIAQACVRRHIDGADDTAIALAEAGFVVAAVTHTGDNSLDRSYSFTVRNFPGRVRHLHRVIDYMLST